MRRFSEMRWEIRQTTKEKIMGIFSMILSLLSGVALFLFGMSLMGDGLKMVAGNKLEAFLYRMTNTPLKAVPLPGAVIFSSWLTRFVLYLIFSESKALQYCSYLSLDAPR